MKISLAKVFTLPYSLSKTVFNLKYGELDLLVPFDALEDVEANLFGDQYSIFVNVKPSFNVIDLGAHVGLFTIPCAKVVGSRGLVIAVEPNPFNLMLLLSNIRRNKITNVRVINKAIWNVGGLRMRFYVTSGVSGSLFRRELLFGEANRLIFDVETISMAEIITRFKIRKIDLLKVDIEGAEIAVFTKNNEWLESVTTIIGETHPDIYGWKGIEKMEDAFKKYGFKFSTFEVKISKVKTLKGLLKSVSSEPRILGYAIYRGITSLKPSPLIIRLFKAEKKR